jgi:16S rRNA G1207 methylase RsmC
MDRDVYFKKVVTLEEGGHTLRLRVAQGLFSSHEVDRGTRLLLRSLAGTGPFRKVLDVGCGYGPIGLALKKANEAGVVHMLDRDALAVDYSRQNAELNRLAGVETYGSLGYDDVADRDFDLIAANIPGKASMQVISYLLLEARHYLRPGGMAAIVVVAPLQRMVISILTGSVDVQVLYREARSGYVLYHYRFSGGPNGETRPDQTALERGVYHRGAMTVAAGDLRFPMKTADGLPQFDSLSYRTELLIRVMRDVGGPAARRAVVFNPGQGHVPVALWRIAGPGHLLLLDRDLLALRYSRENLVLNQCPRERIGLEHRVGVGAQGREPADLMVGVLREGEGAEGDALAVRQAAERLAPGGTLLVASSSTAVTRLVKLVRAEGLLGVVKRRRKQGGSVLVLRRR